MRRLLKTGDYLLAWVVHWVASLAGGAIAGAVGGGVTGAVMRMAGADLETIKIVCDVVGFVLGVAVSCVLFRYIVDALIVRKIEARAAAAENAKNPLDAPRAGA